MAIYIFKSTKDYENFVGVKEPDMLEDIDVQDIFYTKNGFSIVVPDLELPIVNSPERLIHLVKSALLMDGDGDVLTEKYMAYDTHTNRLIINKNNRKVELKVDRFVGDVPKRDSRLMEKLFHKYQLDWGKKIYDQSRNRLCLFLKS